MNNRRIIEKFCKDNDVEIINLEYVRMRDAEYGNTWDASYWELECKINNEIFSFCADMGITIYESIRMMFDVILEEKEANNCA